jgi:hypothetical protein
MNDKNPGWKQVDSLRRFQDAGKKRRVRTDSGKARNLPSLPYEYWCKPSGNLVRLCVMTTRNIEQAVNPTYYANFARATARKDGWFPWQWADAQAYAPGVVAKSGCETREQWDVWREEELQRRRNQHNEQTRRTQAVWLEQAGARKLETQEALSDALKAFTEKVASGATAVPAATAERKPRGTNG